MLRRILVTKLLLNDIFSYMTRSLEVLGNGSQRGESQFLKEIGHSLPDIVGLIIALGFCPVMKWPVLK
jgi:hypothetical protein